MFNMINPGDTRYRYSVLTGAHAVLQEKNGGKMNNLEMIGFYKQGGIHIKKKNRGKFTKSAKAAGQSVQEHAKSVLNNPNATPLQKKRANFARNAAKWKHEEGAKIHKLDGHKSILDNGWIPTTRLKKGIYRLAKGN